MYIQMYLNNIEFEWDENKKILNIKQHDLDFRDGWMVFEQPIIERIDDRYDYAEIRWIALGKMLDVIVVVIYTLRRQKIRIISLRKANKKEREIYEKNIKPN